MMESEYFVFSKLWIWTAGNIHEKLYPAVLNMQERLEITT